MTFRLVPNAVTLDDLERCNTPTRSVISPNSVDFGTDCVKVVEDRRIRRREDSSCNGFAFATFFITFRCRMLEKSGF